MFKIPPFLPPRILPTRKKLYDLENQGPGHYYPLMTLENYFMSQLVIHQKYWSPRVGLSAILHDLNCPLATTVGHWLGSIGKGGI